MSSAHPTSGKALPYSDEALAAARLSALRRLEILDTPPDEAFDRITQLASRIFDMPISLVSLVDEDRQWFKSCWGLADYGVFTRETPLELSFCVHAIAEHDVMVVPDASTDPRFSGNPVVAGSPGIRFYAGAPLRVKIPHIGERRRVELRHNTAPRNGRRRADRRQGERRNLETRVPDDQEQTLAIGTLCLLDTRARTFTPAQRDTLNDLAALVENELRLRFTATLLRNEIDARRNVETALNQSRLRFQTAFEYSAIGMSILSLDGTWLQVNQRLCDLFGYTEAELMEKKFQDLTHPDDLERDLANVQKILSGRAKTYQMAKRYIHRDGHVVWAQLDVSLARDDHGVPQYFISQVQDLTARRAAEAATAAAHAEAEEQRARAERANAAKSEFLSRMSHELRTPLNAVLGFGQLLELSNLTAVDHESAAQIIKAGGHLLSLINEILDIARIEAGHLSLSPEPVLLSDIVIEAVDLVRPLAARRGLTVDEASVRQCHQAILIDRQRFKQALLNILSNAVKYNRENGDLTVNCQDIDDGKIRISVRDQGNGFSPLQAARLFQPFERLDADAHGIEGTGLGLVLARHLVEAMNGSLDFSSEVGQGSTFWVDVPVTSEVPAAGEGAASPLPLAAATSLLVLNIEDNDANVHLMDHIFADQPAVRLMTAMQGRLGLELARQHHPNIVLLDLNLPDISGEEVLTALRADPELKDVPIIILSADATSAQIKHMMDLGANDYLTKPFDVHALLTAVDKALASS